MILFRHEADFFFFVNIQKTVMAIYIQNKNLISVLVVLTELYLWKISCGNLHIKIAIQIKEELIWLYWYDWTWQRKLWNAQKFLIILWNYASLIYQFRIISYKVRNAVSTLWSTLLRYWKNCMISLNSHYLWWYIWGGSVNKESACIAGDLGLIPGSGRSPGERNGNPLQYSCLENSMGRGIWWLQFMGSQSRTKLSD